jgi:hypothetical protein
VKPESSPALLPGLWSLWLLLLICAPCSSSGTGVTIITHGYAGNVDGWVTGMADRITQYYRFPGTNFTTYKISVTKSGGSYFFSTTRTNGSPPTSAESGEIIVKLDWRTLAGGLSPDSTYNVGAATSLALQQTNLIAELGGHALTEFPIHLIGHSRGGSLVCEISRDLGTNGVWVDHVTTLDPHPLNNDGNDDLPSTVDATATNTWASVLFRDNYWQDLGDGLFVPNGRPAVGAYDRQLYTLSSGYSSSHSDVHLWYHCTIDWRNPASDTEASITGTQRTNWWVAYESQGTNAGFLYSLIGGGDRLSPEQPVGPGFQAIRDGYNQYWDLGAGTASNRTSLPSNSGNWPNLIKLNRTATNDVVQGQAAFVNFYYQWAQPTNSTATVSFYLDDDFNPLNSNDLLLKQMPVPGTGADYVSYATVSLTLDATNVTPGYHALYGKIAGGGRTRYLYAPELVQVISSRQPPTLDIAKLNASQFRIGVNGVAGQTIVLQDSTNLTTWLPLATNTLADSRWTYTNTPPGSPGQRFYRAVLSP